MKTETIVGLGILAGIGYVAYQFFSSTGWGSTVQNGHPYSLAAQIFTGQSGDGTGQIYDGTGSVGDAVSTATEALALNQGLTPYDTQAQAKAGFQPGINGVSTNTTTSGETGN